MHTCQSEVHATPGQFNIFLAVEARQELALGLGPGEFAGPGKGHQIPLLFLPSTSGDSSPALPTPSDLEVSRKSLSNTALSLLTEILIGSDL